MHELELSFGKDYPSALLPISFLFLVVFYATVFLYQHIFHSYFKRNPLYPNSNLMRHHMAVLWQIGKNLQNH